MNLCTDKYRYNPLWKNDTCYNALVGPWRRYRFNFLNPNYTLGTSCVYKPIIEFLKGKNSVIVIPSTTVIASSPEEERLKHFLLKLLGKVHKLPIVTF